MMPCCDVSIEQMKKDLYGGGWTSSHGGIVWMTPWGAQYYGPHLAWHKWAGTPIKLDVDTQKEERK